MTSSTLRVTQTSTFPDGGQFVLEHEIVWPMPADDAYRVRVARYQAFNADIETDPATLSIVHTLPGNDPLIVEALQFTERTGT